MMVSFLNINFKIHVLISSLSRIELFVLSLICYDTVLKFVVSHYNVNFINRSDLNLIGHLLF